MTTNTKHTQHKSCSCQMCKRGRSTKAGHAIKKANEHRLRQLWNKALKKLGIEADSAPISSPYTD